jgi:tRNA-uridine 2-sulfurtransferase
MLIKAVGLLSGGLDSAVACQLMLDQGIEVHVVHVSMPWGCGKPSRVTALAERLGIPLKVIPLADDYLSILKKPQYGFGSAHNPCVDCHIYMVKKAAEYMKEIGADFIFTGEVLGQRPMSQRRVCLDWVENDAGVPGRVLRPLSAQLLPPTLPEEQGLVDRSKLLGIVGRSRKEQHAIAVSNGLKEFSQPGGGCLLTEKHFGARIKDVLAHGCDHIALTAVLGLGRYFRVDEDAFVLLGRNDRENEKLLEYAMPDDMILRSFTFFGPAALVRSRALKEEHLALAAGIIQFYSKWRGEAPIVVNYWKSATPDEMGEITSVVLSEDAVGRMSPG